MSKFNEVRTSIAKHKNLIIKFYNEHKINHEKGSQGFYELRATTALSLFSQDEKFRQILTAKSNDFVNDWKMEEITEYNKNLETLGLNAKVMKNKGYTTDIEQFKHFGLDNENKMQYKKTGKIGFY